jgi:hypothetical protein
MFHVPNQYRDRDHPVFGSDDSIGNSGLFIIQKKGVLQYRCLASDGLEWEHVSISIAFPNKNVPLRCPTWDEMCFIKKLFWDEEDCVIQYHPSKDQYVNRHPYVLHLWRPIGQVIPIPPKEMIG